MRPPSGAGVTAGHAASLGLALVIGIAALAAFWAVGHLQPAFQRAYLLDSSRELVSDAAGQPLSLPAQHPSGELSPAFATTVMAWETEILIWSAQFELSPDLIATVMQIESCGDPDAKSPAGAQGLFQVMPYHFRPGEDPMDPEVNARRGLEYLRGALRLAAGDVALALAGYNGGHAQIGRPPSAWPAETVRYVSWGSGILHDLEASATQSQTLKAWMDAGGASLCRQASQALKAYE